MKNIPHHIFVHNINSALFFVQKPSTKTGSDHLIYCGIPDKNWPFIDDRYMMPIMENIIREKLTKALNPQTLEIADESLKHAGHVGARPEGKSHFHITVVSKTFEPLSRLERHRVIYEILKEELDGQIHALSLTLQSPKER